MAQRGSEGSVNLRPLIDINSTEEQEMALTALKEDIDRIEKYFGKTEVPWGEVNVVVRGEQYPMDGTRMYRVLHPDYGIEQDSGQIHCNDGWGHLMIVMEGQPKQIWSLLPFFSTSLPSGAGGVSKELSINIAPRWGQTTIQTCSCYYRRHGVVIQVLSGIGKCLWKILGEVLKQPIYKLLGAHRGDECGAGKRP
jgi:hypothetical protein